MKYKLKFEIVYPGMDKNYIRDIKLDNILSDTPTEIVADSPITPPNRNDIILLEDKEYTIVNIKHKIESGLYTIIVDIESKLHRSKMEEERKQREIKNMINVFTNVR